MSECAIENAPALLKSYERQLCTYAHILERRYGKRPDRLLLYWTSEPKKSDALMAFAYRPELVAEAGCARVSYLTHDGRRAPEEDIALCDRLAGSSPGHWSPFEHVAMAMPTDAPSGNFRGWKQYRKTFLGEHVGGVRS